MAQDDLMTRQMIEEKDKTIGALSAQVRFLETYQLVIDLPMLQVQQYESQMAELMARMQQMEQVLHDKSRELDNVCNKLRYECMQTLEEMRDVEPGNRLGHTDMEGLTTNTAVSEAVQPTEGKQILRDTEVKRPEGESNDVDIEEGVLRSIVGETKKTSQKVRWVDVSDDELIEEIEENDRNVNFISFLISYHRC